MLQENLNKVNDLWKQQGLKLSKPLSENEVIDALSKLEILLSQEVIAVYSNLGGMIDNGTDSICFTFWTVNGILETNKRLARLSSDLVFFADFLIELHLYGFKYENEKFSSIHIYFGENQIEKVANSFDEFFENYLTKPERYFLFGRENTEKILL